MSRYNNKKESEKDILANISEIEKRRQRHYKEVERKKEESWRKGYENPYHKKSLNFPNKRGEIPFPITLENEDVNNNQKPSSKPENESDSELEDNFEQFLFDEELNNYGKKNNFERENFGGRLEHEKQKNQCLEIRTPNYEAIQRKRDREARLAKLEPKPNKPKPTTKPISASIDKKPKAFIIE
jgi:hypothetical protein